MTKTIEAKTVREARAAARKIAKKGERTYQQALDDIARNAGHDHWSAFVAAHPSTEMADTPAKPQTVRRRRADTASLVRSFMSGEIGQRNQAALEREAVKDGMHSVTFSIVTRLVDTMFWVWMLGVWFIPEPPAISSSMSTTAVELIPPVAAAAIVLGLYGIARIVGDHPSMVLRRAQLLLICNSLAAGFFVLGIIAAAMAYKYPGTLIPFRYLYAITNVQAVTLGILGAVFFRVVGRNGVRVMAIAAPATVQPSTTPDTQIPGWLSAALDGAIALCLLAGVAGLILLLADGLALLFGGDLKVGTAEFALLVGPIPVVLAAYGIRSHFGRLGYLADERRLPA